MLITTNFMRPIVILWLFTFTSTLVAAYASATGILAITFLVTSSITEANLFCLPVLALAFIQIKYAHLKVPSKIGAHVLLLTSFGTILFLLGNYKLHSIYGFYMNYFVLNLLSTPGGVEAMGVSESTYYTLAFSIIALAGIYMAAMIIVPFENLFTKKIRPRNIIYTMLTLFFVQASLYAYADYRYHQSILQVADKVVWYLPVTAKSIMADLGFERAETAFASIERHSQDSGDLNYPNISANQLTIEKKYNIVWLVAESWRADMVTAEIMPSTHQFALENNWFTNHYSGGNGTRMGMFSQFYGLYGSYWFDVFNAQRPPLIMDVLEQEKYQLMAYTSSAFSYPEFDKTVFSNFPDSSLQAYSEGLGWERDRKNTTDLINFIESTEGPFFSFMFFESAHANYYFPEEDIIDENFIDDFNYISLDIENNIDGIKARYTNANHHLDSQLARVFQALENNQLMDNTIVIVTGDHGEEFFEKGRWGHNSTFSQEQIRVPLILHLPSGVNGIHDKMTSHIDLPATVFTALEVSGLNADYSYGSDLMAEDFERDFVVASDWHGNVLITPEIKIVFSSKGALYNGNITSIDDQPIDARDTSLSYRASLTQFTQELPRFYH
jgi:membrane-anchored protein YejM (alkaline phosphatase superfamily)